MKKMQSIHSLVNLAFLLSGYHTCFLNCLIVRLYHLLSWISSMSNISSPRSSICVDTQILLVSGPNIAIMMEHDGLSFVCSMDEDLLVSITGNR